MNAIAEPEVTASLPGRPVVVDRPEDRPQPKLDAQALADRQASVARELLAVLPAGSVLWEPTDTRPYECDGLSMFRQLPMVVVLPDSEQQVAAVLRICARMQVPVVARGAGTSLSGGAMPHGEGVLLALGKLSRIVSIDAYSRTAVVQPGVRNLAISEAAAAARSLLCAGSFVADRVQHRRQRRGELGRRPLPEIRPDDPQRAQGARPDDGRRGRRVRVRSRPTRPASTCCR